MVYIGIDPDVERSGVGIVIDDRMGVIKVDYYSATFEELVCKVDMFKAFDAMVVIEAGWKNQKTSWHMSAGDTKAVAAKKGHGVGRNHQIAHDIASLCKAKGVKYLEVAPLRKCWKGREGKITHEELDSFAHLPRKRSNQEERDAVLLAWCYIGLPIRVKPQRGA